MPELTGRQLDAAVAANIYNLDVKTEGGEATWKAKEVGWRYWSSLPHFSTSLDCAQSIESEIERRGLVDQHIRNLAHILGWVSLLPPVLLATPEDIFRFRRATPEQICRAALKAVRGIGNDPAHQLS